MSTDALLPRLAPVLAALTDQRGQDVDWANRELDELTTQWPAEVTLLLAQVCALGVGGFQNDARLLASILVRRVPFKTLSGLHLNPSRPRPTAPFDIIAERSRERIEKVLCTGLEDEMNPSIRKALGTSAALWAKESARRQRPCVNIPPVLFKLTQSERPLHRFTPYQIISEYPTLLADSVTDASFKDADLMQILQAGLHDPSLDVKVEAIKAIKAMIVEGGSFVKDKSHKTALLVEVCSVLTTLSRDALDAALEAIVDIANSYPALFIPFIDSVVPFMLSLLSPPRHDMPVHNYSPYPLSDLEYSDWENVANQASEIVLAMVEAYPSEFNKPERKIYIESLAGLYIAHQIGGFGDQLDCRTWLALIDPEEPDDEYPEYAEEALDRLSWALRSGGLLNALAGHMDTLIHHPDWRARYCMLRALAVVMPGSYAAVHTYLDSIHNFAGNLRNDPHPRVRAGWLELVQALATQCEGAFQKRYMLQAIEECVQLLDDRFLKIKVMAIDTLASIFFADHASYMTEFGAQHLAAFNKRIFDMPNRSLGPLCMAIFRLLSNMSECLPEECRPVYELWMEDLLSVAFYEGEEEDPSPKVQGAALIAATKIGMAMDKQVFVAQYAPKVSQILLKVHNSIRGDDDPRKEPLQIGWHNLSRIIGSNIGSCFPYIIPPLLTTAGEKPFEGEQDGKCYALETLTTYAQFGAVYAPYLEPTFKVVYDALLPPNSASVIEAAAYLAPVVLHAAKSAQMLDPQAEIIAAVLYRMLDSIKCDTTFQVSAILYKAIADTLRVLHCVPPAFLPKRLLTIADAQVSTFAYAKQERRDASDGWTQDDVMYAQFEDDDENDILSQMANALAVLVDLGPDDDLRNTIENLVNFIQTTVDLSVKVTEL